MHNKEARDNIYPVIAHQKNIKTCVYCNVNYAISDVDGNEINLASVCKAYDPPYSISTCIYDYIKENIDKWCEEAISIGNRYPK